MVIHFVPIVNSTSFIPFAVMVTPGALPASSGRNNEQYDIFQSSPDFIFDFDQLITTQITSLT
jgi:hypothetical protein